MTTCSAPGKILLAGGYLVLDPAYSGLVLSLSARIYVTVRPTTEQCTIVESPQFEEAVWTFRDGKPVGQDNPFIRETLNALASYFKTSSNVHVTIYADNEYYSLNRSSSRFTKAGTTIGNSPKSGLGSSAALVTALTAALYIHHRMTLSEDDKWRIHNLAQWSHSKAQGKVGSGFDIAAAVFGSCLYTRFPASVLQSSIDAIIDTRWPMHIDRVQLRDCFKLLMGDVSKGSSTPGMVKKVLASTEALEVWPSLAIANELLVEQLTASGNSASLRETTRSVRGLLKQMGDLCDVQIEPDAQTKVLDETLEVNGVVSCGVPGAGGDDAIFAIIERSSDAEHKLRQLWSTSGIKMMDVSDEGDGIRLEADFDHEISPP